MPLSAADRAFLSQEWRYAEAFDPTLLARHPGARQADYQSAFVEINGAQLALDVIVAATAGGRRLLIGTCDGILPVNFKGRPPYVRVRTARFGFDVVNGRAMLVERSDFDHGASLTTLYLTG